VNVNIIGSGLDSLVTCFQLLEKGYEVTLYSGGKKLAGHFSGLKNDHATFDLGMVLLEKEDRGEVQKDVIHYNGEFGFRSRKFLKQTFHEIQRILGESEPDKVKSLLSNGIEEKDYFISDNLNVFDYLNGQDKKILTKRLEDILNGRTPEFTHPKLKWDNDNIQQNPLSFNLNLMYGQKIYQEYFGKFLCALTGSSEVSLPMRYHRKAWIPLYYPESVLSRMKDPSNDVSSIEFFKFKRNSVALAIENLILNIYKNTRFKLVNEAFAELSHEIFKSEKSIYLLSIKDLGEFFSQPPVNDFSLRMSQQSIALNANKITFLHLCISKQENKTVFLQDPYKGLFRYSINSSRDGNLSNVCFEFGYGAPKSMEEMVKTSHKFLGSSKILCKGQTNSVNYVQKYHAIGMDEWERRVFEVGETIKIPSSQIYVIHPDGLSFNDNFVRGLAAASRI
jgi:hypothetical protein